MGFFLGGLVVRGGVQGWWIEPVLGRLSEIPLMLGATILTAFNDNAAVTFLSTLVPAFMESLKYAVVAGAVAGGVEVAFVPGRMKSLAQNTDLVSLGSLFFEPLWILHRQDLALRRLTDLKGLRLAVGEEGSGTKVLTMQLLELNGVNAQNT